MFQNPNRKDRYILKLMNKVLYFIVDLYMTYKRYSAKILTATS